MSLALSTCGSGRIHEIDFYGIVIGFFCFFAALIYVYNLLRKFDLNRKMVLNVVLISAAGHIIGSYFLYWFAITYGADSCFYFDNAHLKYEGSGYFFAFFIMGYLREYLLGDSFLGAFLIAGALGFIGSVYYFLTYKILLDRLSLNHRLYRIDKKQLLYPAILLLCWPSYFFWSAGLGKDSFIFLSIGMILFLAAQSKFTISNLVKFIIATFFGFMFRPYLFVIFAGSAGIYMLLGSKVNVYIKTAILSLILITTYLFIQYMTQYGVLFSGSLSQVGEHAVLQQERMNGGSAIPIPTHNPYFTFLFLPYLGLANLLLPLGIGARNLIGIISSIENAYFLAWITFFIRNRLVWNKLKSKINITKFFMIYFMFGMAFLSLISTNLGLAMREKMMYVPAFLICIFLTYAYRRMLIIQNHYKTELFELTENAVT